MYVLFSIKLLPEVSCVCLPISFLFILLILKTEDTLELIEALLVQGFYESKFKH